MDNVIDYICAVAHHRTVFYLWRPYLKDPQDDMVLELAVTAACDFIVTYRCGFVGSSPTRSSDRTLSSTATG